MVIFQSSINSLLIYKFYKRILRKVDIASTILYIVVFLNLLNTSLHITGTVYIIPVVGGYIADSIAGKYNTILGSGLIYVLGKLSYKLNLCNKSQKFTIKFNITIV